MEKKVNSFLNGLYGVHIFLAHKQMHVVLKSSLTSTVMIVEKEGID